MVPRLTSTVTTTQPTERKKPPATRQSASVALASAYSEARRLTHRDHYLLQLLIDHQVLTSDQITAIAFDNPRRARRRLLLLTQRGVLARFRHPIAVGSQSWRYTAGILGETIHAATTGQPIPRPAKITERITRLTHTPELDHRIGVNGFFTALIAHTRHHPNTELAEWWSAQRTANTTGTYIRPDGYGLWRQHTLTNRAQASGTAEVAFFLEYDRGTEQQSRLIDKLERYSAMTRAGINKPILFVFTSDRREKNYCESVRNQARWRYANLRIATTALDAPHWSPARPVWLQPDQPDRPRQLLVSISP